MTNLGERIRALATGQAAFFRLKMQLTDNSVRVFPPEEGCYYKVGEFYLADLAWEWSRPAVRNMGTYPAGPGSCHRLYPRSSSVTDPCCHPANLLSGRRAGFAPLARDRAGSAKSRSLVAPTHGSSAERGDGWQFSALSNCWPALRDGAVRRKRPPILTTYEPGSPRHDRQPPRHRCREHRELKPPVLTAMCSPQAPASFIQSTASSNITSSGTYRSRRSGRAWGDIVATTGSDRQTSAAIGSDRQRSADILEDIGSDRQTSWKTSAAIGRHLGRHRQRSADILEDIGSDRQTS